MQYFRISKVEVANQLDRKIKVRGSDRGGEYYGRYDEISYNPRPFARFLEQHGVITLYSLFDTPL